MNIVDRVFKKVYSPCNKNVNKNIALIFDDYDEKDTESRMPVRVIYRVFRNGALTLTRKKVMKYFRLPILHMVDYEMRQIRTCVDGAAEDDIFSIPAEKVKDVIQMEITRCKVEKRVTSYECYNAHALARHRRGMVSLDSNNLSGEARRTA